MDDRTSQLADQIRASRTALGYYQPALIEFGRVMFEDLRPHPLSEWSEDDGEALWWKFPIEEAPYVGTPLDLGQTVEITVRAHGVDKLMRVQVGGWPGYHTHWTRLPPAPQLRTTQI